jgi:hypothetical protein
MTQQYSKNYQENAAEASLAKKAEFTADLANLLLFSFQVKINPILNKLPSQGIDSTSQYLATIQANRTDLVKPDKGLILSVCKRHEQTLDLSNILKFFEIEQADQFFQTPNFASDGGDPGFEELVQIIGATFESALNDTVSEFYAAKSRFAPTDLATMQQNFGSLLSEKVSAKFGLLNAVLEIKPKPDLWQKLLSLFRKSHDSLNQN